MALITLEAFLGSHVGIARTYFKPGDAPQEAPIEVTGAWALGKRFLRLTYTSALMGQPIEAELLVGYAAAERLFKASWMDTVHTGDSLMLLTGMATETGCRLKGDYHAGEGAPRWGWWVDLEVVTGIPGIRMHNVPPGGEPYLGVQFVLD